MSDAASDPSPPAADPRIFLVVVDDTEEWRNAPSFSPGRRAPAYPGPVRFGAACVCWEPAEFQHWIGGRGGR